MKRLKQTSSKNNVKTHTHAQNRMSQNFYTAPSYMTGGYTVYGGYRRQRGGGIFSSFRSSLAPIGRQALAGMKSIAKNQAVRQIARQAAEKGAEVLAGVAVDAIQGRNIGDSIKERAKDAALQSLGATPATTTPARKKKRKLKQKKQSATAKNIAQPPSKKRRRRFPSRAALNRKNLF